MEGIAGILSRFQHSTAVSGSKRRILEKESTTVAEQGNHELLSAIRDTVRQLEAMRTVFDHETDSDLIDADILEMEALEKRYSYLLKQAKQAQLRAF